MWRLFCGSVFVVAKLVLFTNHFTQLYIQLVFCEMVQLKYSWFVNVNRRRQTHAIISATRVKPCTTYAFKWPPERTAPNTKFNVHTGRRTEKIKRRNSDFYCNSNNIHITERGALQGNMTRGRPPARAVSRRRAELVLFLLDRLISFPWWWFSTVIFSCARWPWAWGSKAGDRRFRLWNIRVVRKVASSSLQILQR